MNIPYIDGDEIARILDAESCTAIMRQALIGLEQGQGMQFLRTAHQVPGGIFAFMPAVLGADFFGAKVLSVFHGNIGSDIPAHQGLVILFDAARGSPLAMLDATAITAIRTGAVSAVGTDLLARKDADTLALLGCGSQAISHLRAIRHVRSLSRVTVWDIDGKRSAEFAARMKAETGLDVAACETARDAVSNAGIICTLTPSHTPVLEAAWVQPGAHINAVGACRAADRELDSDLVASARFYGDSRESVLNESGDFLIPLREGRFAEDHFRGAIGALALGRIAGRENDAGGRNAITIFEALGLAVEDIAAAAWVYQHYMDLWSGV
jgi:ornithine cyclodeaminase